MAGISTEISWSQAAKLLLSLAPASPAINTGSRCALMEHARVRSTFHFRLEPWISLFESGRIPCGKQALGEQEGKAVAVPLVALLIHPDRSRAAKWETLETLQILWKILWNLVPRFHKAPDCGSWIGYR